MFKKYSVKVFILQETSLRKIQKREIKLNVYIYIYIIFYFFVCVCGFFQPSSGLLKNVFFLSFQFNTLERDSSLA